MKKIPILKAFDNVDSMYGAMYDFAHMHVECYIDSNKTITLPHTKVFFRVFKESEDVYDVAGLVFSQVDLHGRFNKYIIDYLRSRIRYPYIVAMEEAFKRYSERSVYE